jgi:hypothetical protein
LGFGDQGGVGGVLNGFSVTGRELFEPLGQISTDAARHVAEVGEGIDLGSLARGDVRAEAVLSFDRCRQTAPGQAVFSSHGETSQAVPP